MSQGISLRSISVTRYVTPLRQGGSLPAIMEADDEGLYVVKFRGAAQGLRMLVAELIAGEIARALGLLMPELVFAALDPVLGHSEPDYEIRSLLEKSGGRNLGLDFLPGALDYTPMMPAPPADLASLVVWLDAYVTNVDRTVRNPNMLVWHKRLWLIDHGAALYFHHDWDGYLDKVAVPFPRISQHPLLPHVTEQALADADAHARRVLTDRLLNQVTAFIPDDWLDEPAFTTPDAHRSAYATYLAARRDASRRFTETILDARLAASA